MVLELGVSCFNTVSLPPGDTPSKSSSSRLPRTFRARSCHFSARTWRFPEYGWPLGDSFSTFDAPPLDVCPDFGVDAGDAAAGDAPLTVVWGVGVELRRDEKNPTFETLRRTPKVLAEWRRSKMAKPRFSDLSSAITVSLHARALDKHGGFTVLGQVCPRGQMFLGPRHRDSCDAFSTEDMGSVFTRLLHSSLWIDYGFLHSWVVIWCQRQVKYFWTLVGPYLGTTLHLLVFARGWEMERDLRKEWQRRKEPITSCHLTFSKFLAEFLR